MSLNETHDPALRSWVESAAAPGTDFPIQNLPFGVFRPRPGEAARVGVAIGDRILDVSAGWKKGWFFGEAATAAAACCLPSLNGLLSLGPDHWSALRERLSQLLRVDGPARVRASQLSVDKALVRMADAVILLPSEIGDFTDFYSSLHHATRVGRMFRPDNPLLPNYKHVPIAYHGRASSVVVSGAEIRRPCGQTLAAGAATPVFGPSQLLDYEAEVGFLVGQGNPLGLPLSMLNAEAHIFGFCLVNDWSARDIQAWEYQPLGPFLAKSFATTMSPWVITHDALEPFRAALTARAGGDPEPLPYLSASADRATGAIDLTVEVWLASGRMRQSGIAPVRLSRASFRDMYWTPAQMLVHHASNGCNLRSGDLIASGTVSGPERDSAGCLLELTMRSAEPLSLPGGETRRFLEDGDEVILRGHCERPGCARIGFGECRGTVVP